MKESLYVCMLLSTQAMFTFAVAYYPVFLFLKISWHLLSKLMNPINHLISVKVMGVPILEVPDVMTSLIWATIACTELSKHTN